MNTNELEEEIKKLEAAARVLEPGSEDRKRITDSVLQYCEAFMQRLDTATSFIQKGFDNSTLGNANFTDGQDINDIMQLLHQHMEDPGINTAGGGHLGYIPGGGLYAAALGDYIADVTNKYAGVFYASPGAVRIENSLVNWAGKLIGYTEAFGGNITSGGSIGNLVAITTARDAKQLKGKDFHKTVIYTTSLSHHSIDKAIIIAGLRECIVHRIPLDENYKMDCAALEQQIAADKAAGLVPFLVVANAGSTDIGSVDPLYKISQIAYLHDIWMHVDGAYGGCFMLLDEYRQQMHGIQYADSVVMDPHKGMFLPYGTGIVLVKRLHHLQNAFLYEANYMQDTTGMSDEISPALVSPELSKHFRGMRMWLPLKLYGEQPFKDCLREKLLLTRYFCNTIQDLGFEIVTEPELTVVAYRYVPQGADANAFNIRLAELMHADGDIFISSTNLDGKYLLRFAALSFRTHMSHVNRLLDMFRRHLPACKDEFGV